MNLAQALQRVPGPLLLHTASKDSKAKQPFSTKSATHQGMKITNKMTRGKFVSQPHYLLEVILHAVVGLGINGLVQDKRQNTNTTRHSAGANDTKLNVNNTRRMHQHMQHAEQ